MTAPTFQNKVVIQYINPYTTLADTPYTITVPAMVNILAPTSRIKHSACVQLGPIYSCSVRTQSFGKIFTLRRQYSTIIQSEVELDALQY